MKAILAATIFVFAGLGECQATILANWTFETSQPTTAGPISPEVGSGTASSSGVLNLNSPSGNGSAHSYSGNTWAVGDYFQFSVATIGFQDIKLSWAQSSSSTGPGEFKLAYQVNGGGFTDFLDYKVLPNQSAAPGAGIWNMTTAIAAYNYTVDLSSISALDNAASVVFRLIVRTTADSTPPGTIATAGTSRVDDFKIDATPIPEASEWGVISSIGLLAIFGLRTWRERRSSIAAN
jgi:hypothetical protein